jgi:hypothetical protein
MAVSLEEQADYEYDTLVPDPQVAREFGTTLMGLWRWDHDPHLAKLGWGPPVKIRNRNHRSRRVIEAFKAALMRRAIKERSCATKEAIR